jgi:hypothetical protein
MAPLFPADPRTGAHGDVVAFLERNNPGRPALPCKWHLQIHAWTDEEVRIAARAARRNTSVRPLRANASTIAVNDRTTADRVARILRRFRRVTYVILLRNPDDARIPDEATVDRILRAMARIKSPIQTL